MFARIEAWLVRQGCNGMKKWAVFAAVMVLLMTVSPQAMAYRGRDAGSPCLGGDFSSVPGLRLSEEQKAKTETLREAYGNEIQPLLSEMAERRSELRRLWLQKSPEQDRIATAQRDYRTLRGTMSDRFSRYREDVYNLMNRDQQDALESYGPTRACFGSGALPGMGKGVSMDMGGSPEDRKGGRYGTPKSWR